MRILVVAAVILGLASASVGAGPLDFTVEIKNIDGSDFVDQAGKAVPLTFARVAENALLAPEANLSGEESVKRYSLALKIHQNPKDVNLDAEQTSLLKKLIPKLYGPFVTGEAWKIMDPASIPKM